VVSRYLEAVKNVANSLPVISENNFKQNHLFYKCDVTDFKQVQEVVSNLEQTVGKINILVNAAGCFLLKSLITNQSQYKIIYIF